VSAGSKELEQWLEFRVRCRGIGKLSICLHGRWNVGIYPEKGMMSQLCQEGP
jgi:hypothetical protein